MHTMRRSVVGPLRLCELDLRIVEAKANECEFIFVEPGAAAYRKRFSHNLGSVRAVLPSQARMHACSQLGSHGQGRASSRRAVGGLEVVVVDTSPSSRGFRSMDERPDSHRIERCARGRLCQ